MSGSHLDLIERIVICQAGTGLGNNFAVKLVDRRGETVVDGENRFATHEEAVAHSQEEAMILRGFGVTPPIVDEVQARSVPTTNPISDPGPTPSMSRTRATKAAGGKADTAMVKKRGAAAAAQQTAADRAWTDMVDKEWAAHDANRFEGVRRDVGAQMGRFQQEQSGEAGDRDVRYQQKVHWAFLDLIAETKLIAIASIGVMQMLSDRVTELEQAREKAAPGMIYRGVFTEGETYDPGNTATFAGSLWHCNQKTKERPGEASKAWTLCVKRGRDGRDARP